MHPTPAASGALPRLVHALFVIQLISMGAMEMSGPFWPVHLQSLDASPGVLALRFLQGACAGYLAPAQAYGVSAVVPAVRGRLFAYLQVSTNVGSLAGALAGGLILDHATFFWINLIAALLCALCAAAVAVLLPRRPAAGSALGGTELQSLPPLSGNAAPLQPPSWFESPVAGLLAVLGILLVARMLT